MGGSLLRACGLALVFLAVVSGCTTTEEQVQGRYVYWTSPDPVVGVLERVVIYQASDSITGESILAATVNVIVDDPLPMGSRDSVFISGENFWIAAVSYNDKNPTLRSPVSNSLCLCSPQALVLGWE